MTNERWRRPSFALQQAIDFYEGLVEDDVFSLKSFPLRRDCRKSRAVIRSYSRHIGGQSAEKELLRDVSEDCSIDEKTLSKYLLSLRKLYVIKEMEAWKANLLSKSAVRSKPTRYFMDPSIATSCLGLTRESLFRDMRTFLFLFETLAIRDLRIYADCLGARICRCRDSCGREADAVIVFNDGEWALVEIKLGDEGDINSACEKLFKLSRDIKQEKENPSFLWLSPKAYSPIGERMGFMPSPWLCCATNQQCKTKRAKRGDYERASRLFIMALRKVLQAKSRR